MGVYRFWPDLGYAVGALLSGVVADLFGMRAAIKVVVLTFFSGMQVALRMGETLRRAAVVNMMEGSLRIMTREQGGNE